MKRRRQWKPTETRDIESLLFKGAPELVSWLEGLISRPRAWSKDRLLPITYLVLPNGIRSPLEGIEDRLDQFRRTPPHSRIGDSQATILHLLDRAVADLSTKNKGAKIRFSHYSLAVWLQELQATAADRSQLDQPDRLVDTKLYEFIKKRYHSTNGLTSQLSDLVSEFPFYVRALAWPWSARLAMGIMRLLWRPPRWFARKHAVGKAYGRSSFRGLTRAFMRRDTSTDPESITPDAVEQLLVDAFLEDLWRAYRRRTIFGRGRRRTLYPILLVDNAGASSNAFRLLKLVAKSRDDAGRRIRPSKPYRPDPLLIVAAGDEAGHDNLAQEVGPDQETHSVEDAAFAYDQWSGRMDRADRYRTWFLPLRPQVREDAGGAHQKIYNTALPTVRRPVAPVLVAALLVVTGTTVLIDRLHFHCGSWYWESTLTRIADQCIGLAPDGYRFFDDIPESVGLDDELKKQLSQVENNIYDTNERIERAGNGYLTVVYLSRLTPKDVQGYQLELEQLRGIEVAQFEKQHNRPVRVLLANAGDGMDHGRQAAESIIAEARADDTLVAVLGLGISRDGTREAMIRLGGARIPMIGTFISATDLAETTTDYYHQIGPTNSREAAVAAQYAKIDLKVKQAYIYYTGDSQDLYSSDLRRQAKQEFEFRQIAVEEQAYKVEPDGPGIELSLLGRRACTAKEDAVVFYAGRAEHLPEFLDGMKSACEGRYPKLLSGDDATSFVLAGGLANFPGLALDYLSFGSSLAWGPECDAAKGKVGFFVTYDRHYNAACNRTRDGHAIVAYDSFVTFTQAVENAPDNNGKPTSVGVLAGLNEISSNASGALSGASGEIDYRPVGHPIPADKAVLILRGLGPEVPKRVLLCGRLPTAEPPPDTSRCPPSIS